MATMKALIADRGILGRAANMITKQSYGTGVTVKEVARPTISANELLVQVRATALNPIDFKFIDFIAPAGSKTGCDFAGVVAEIGSNASSKWKIGDRVAGFVQGGITTEYGSFADYVKAEGDLVWKIPESISDNDASTYGVSTVTAMQVLHLHFDVPWPDEVQNGKTDSGSPVLIYSGSTSVGLTAIQLAKAAGCTVVTTASPRSFDLVKSYGADAVFDYRSSTAVQDITKAYPNINRALDCISEGTSTKFCEQVLAKNGGKVITLLPVKSTTSGVEVKMIMSFQMLGRPFAWLPPVGPKFPVSAEDREALVRFYSDLHNLALTLKTPPVKVLQGGFDKVLEGLQMLRAGKVSGSKLVVQFEH